MSRKLIFMSALAWVATGCVPGGTTGGGGGSGPAPTLDDPTTIGSEDTSNDNTSAAGSTFDHPRVGPDPLELLERVSEEGPPEISSRMHSCQKIKYDVLGNVLQRLGVNLARTATPPSAGQLYGNRVLTSAGALSLGVANYPNRIPEAIPHTAASAVKTLDIFVQAAPEVIAAMPTNVACNVKGVATTMFDAGGKCTLLGIACLKGAPATADEKALCDEALTQGTGTITFNAQAVPSGQIIAVATILSAAHACE